MQYTVLSSRPPGPFTRRLSRRFCLAFLGAVLLLWTLPVKAGLTNYRLCFPTVINVPGPTFQVPPTIDGVIDGDFGWTGGFRYLFGNGTPTPHAVVQGVKDGSFIYLSFEVNNDLSFEDQDVIVIAFDPDGTAANQRRLHIYPNFTGGGGGTAPRDVQYWQNSTTWNTTSAGTPPAGTVIAVTRAGAGPVQWNVEMKLPISGFGLPATPFGFYFNVMRYAGTMVNEKHWPPLPDSPDIGLFDTNTPSATTWGNGALSGPCNGVSISPADITTNQTPPRKIATDAANIFSVLVHNNSIDDAGTAIAANQVNATFKIANFGLPPMNAWNLMPVTSGTNPTPFTTMIPGGGGTSTINVGWTLTPAQVTQYSTPATTHQCILVELNSTDTTTTFVNRSAWQNMDFGPASVFDHTAEISAKGYELPPGKSRQEFDLLVTTREDKAGQGPTSVAANYRKSSQLTWVACGTRHTGKFITSLGKKFEIVEDVGCFGYVVQHQGEVAAWPTSFSGEGLKQTGKNMYRISIPKDGVATVSTRVEAREPGQPPPKPKKCGQAKNFAGEATILFAGIFTLGLGVYLPRRRRKP